MPLTEFSRSPFGKWVGRMERRIRRYEWRAKLGEARANACKWSKTPPPRQGRSKRRTRASS
jgi:hypothetical protein